MKNKEEFKYQYVAPTIEERQEIEAIRNQYLESSNSIQEQMKLLRKLNKKATTFPKVIAYVLGCVFVLVFGLGLTFILEWKLTIVGVIITTIGAILMSITHLLYKVMLNHQQKKYTPQIIELSNQLLNK